MPLGLPKQPLVVASSSSSHMPTVELRSREACDEHIRQRFASILGLPLEETPAATNGAQDEVLQSLPRRRRTTTSPIPPQKRARTTLPATTHEPEPSATSGAATHERNNVEDDDAHESCRPSMCCKASPNVIEDDDEDESWGHWKCCKASPNVILTSQAKTLDRNERPVVPRDAMAQSSAAAPDLRPLHYPSNIRISQELLQEEGFGELFSDLPPIVLDTCRVPECFSHIVERSPQGKLVDHLWMRLTTPHAANEMDVIHGWHGTTWSHVESIAANQWRLESLGYRTAASFRHGDVYFTKDALQALQYTGDDGGHLADKYVVLCEVTATASRRDTFVRQPRVIALWIRPDHGSRGLTSRQRFTIKLHEIDRLLAFRAATGRAQATIDDMNWQTAYTVLSAPLSNAGKLAKLSHCRL